MRARLAGIACSVLVASVASAQSPLTLHVGGLVHRQGGFGCGQSWMAREAWSTATLDVTARGRATLVVDAHTLDESGGVTEGQAYHGAERHHHRIEWTGRARREAGRLVIALSGLIEREDVAAAPGTEVENRTTLEATLACTVEERDVLTGTRPPEGSSDRVIGHRSLTVCLFEIPAREGPLPRPVAELLTTPFFLADGAGITTDANDRGDIVVREPGGFTVP